MLQPMSTMCRPFNTITGTVFSSHSHTYLGHYMLEELNEISNLFASGLRGKIILPALQGSLLAGGDATPRSSAKELDRCLVPHPGPVRIHVRNQSSLPRGTHL